MPEQVVITGVGIVSPIGVGHTLFWEHCLKGTSGVRRLQAFDASGYKSTVAAEVLDFDPSAFMPAQKIDRLDRFAQFGIAAAKMALEDAGLETDSLSPYRIGISCGSGLGGIRACGPGSRAPASEFRCARFTRNLRRPR